MGKFIPNSFKSHRTTKKMTTPDGHEVDIIFRFDSLQTSVEAYDPRSKVKAIGIIPMSLSLAKLGIPREQDLKIAEENALRNFDSMIKFRRHNE